MLIGEGNHLYRWCGDWAKLPSGMEFGYTHGVAVDRCDNVYIFNQSRNALCVFNREGTLIRSWGDQFATGAHGLFISRQGHDEFLWLVDHDLKKSIKYTLDGNLLLELRLPPRPDIYSGDQDFKPTDVCDSPNGDIYVFDGYGMHWVHQYREDGTYIRSFGGAGSGAGQFICPHGGWVDLRRADPELYVADRGNNRIQVFTLDGIHKRFITAGMCRPCCFYEFNGEMYIPDLWAQVTILDEHDQRIACLGANSQAPVAPGWPNIQDKLQPGKFNSPHALCVDSHGDIYVVEWISTGRVTKLIRQIA
jgi:hypothetical protein